MAVIVIMLDNQNRPQPIKKRRRVKKQNKPSHPASNVIRTEEPKEEQKKTVEKEPVQQEIPVKPPVKEKVPPVKEKVSPPAKQKIPNAATPKKRKPPTSKQAPQSHVRMRNVEQQKEADERYKEYLADKTVAIVGPAGSIMGTNQGEEIDSFDIVVRVNSYKPKFTTEHSKDIGSRSSILYGLPSFIKESINNQDVLKCGFEWIVIGQPVSTGNYRQLIDKIETYKGLDYLWIYNNTKQELQKKVKKRPSTGLLSIVHLLSFPLKHLKIFGMDFYHSYYYNGYGRDSVKRTAFSAHDQPAQFSWFKREIAPNNRVSLDVVLTEIMKQETGTWKK